MARLYEGQRVKLLPNKEEGWKAEYGKIEDYEGDGMYIVRLEKKYRGSGDGIVEVHSSNIKPVGKKLKKPKERKGEILVDYKVANQIISRTHGTLFAFKNDGDAQKFAAKVSGSKILERYVTIPSGPVPKKIVKIAAKIDKNFIGVRNN